MKPADTERQDAFKAVAEGYPYHEKDGHWLVENPKYKPDNGENPYLLLQQPTARVWTEDEVIKFLYRAHYGRGEDELVLYDNDALFATLAAYIKALAAKGIIRVKP